MLALKMSVAGAVLVASAIVVTVSAPAAPSVCPRDQRILFVSCDTPFVARMKSLGKDPVPEGPDNSLTITGTYSSGDRFGIEGIAIETGKLVSNRFQGWDGLAVITPEGAVSLHHVERVRLGQSRFNLRNADERRAFKALARNQRLSAIQSHLLIVDGAVDVQDRANQPRFRRRILFLTKQGDVGVFDTGGRAMTLFDAATALQEAVAPQMALNLDMGAYDYCAWKKSSLENCGFLTRNSTGVLTNVLVFTFTP